MTPPLFASALGTLFGVLMCVTAIFLMLIVLVQRGRGGGLAGAFGGAGGQSAFGTKAGDLFTRITIGVATFWILLCIAALGLLGKEKSRFGEDEKEDAETSVTAPADTDKDKDAQKAPTKDGGTSSGSGGGAGASAGGGSTEGGGGSTEGGGASGGTPAGETPAKDDG